MRRPAAALELREAAWTPKGARAPFLQPTRLQVAPGRILGVVGPNGAGKTTLLRLVYRFLRPSAGTVLIDGQDIWSLSAREVARHVAAVLQEHPTDFALSVRDIVALGRTPHRPGPGDAQTINAALTTLGLQDMADRALGTLSGGEKQRVMVARALTQEPRLLVLDEPTNHLDIRHQLEILRLLRDLPLTVVTSLHDLNMAAALCDDILLLKEGRTVGFGPAKAVLNQTAISEAFDVVTRHEHLSPSNTSHLTFHLKTERPNI